MYRLLPLTVLLLALPLAAQQSDDAETPDNTEAAAAEGDDVAADDELDDLEDLDDLYPVEDEDEFVPSEDVAFGQSIPFPTDI